MKAQKLIQRHKEMTADLNLFIQDAKAFRVQTHNKVTALRKLRIKHLNLIEDIARSLRSIVRKIQAKAENFIWDRNTMKQAKLDAKAINKSAEAEHVLKYLNVKK